MTLQLNITVHNGETEAERNAELAAVQAALNVLRDPNSVFPSFSTLEPYKGGPLTPADVTPKKTESVPQKAVAQTPATEARAAEAAVLAEALNTPPRGRGRPPRNPKLEQPTRVEESTISNLLDMPAIAASAPVQIDLEQSIADLLGGSSTTQPEPEMVAAITEEDLSDLLGSPGIDAAETQVAEDPYASMTDAEIWAVIADKVNRYKTPFAKMVLDKYKVKTFRELSREQYIEIIREEETNPFDNK